MGKLVHICLEGKVVDRVLVEVDVRVFVNSFVAQLVQVVRPFKLLVLEHLFCFVVRKIELLILRAAVRHDRRHELVLICVLLFLQFFIARHPVAATQLEAGFKKSPLEDLRTEYNSWLILRDLNFFDWHLELSFEKLS